MELHQLRGFLAVAKLGSFTKAAEALYLSQPALSLQVKALEASLGEVLFERQGRGLLLTPAGRILLRQAEEALGLLEQAGQEVAALKGLSSGRLVIGTNDSYCLYLLPELIQLYRHRYPGIELDLTNDCSTQVAARVAEGTVDFGLVTLPIVDDHLVSKPLFWREDVLICAPGHPLCDSSDVTLEQVAGYPLLLLDRGSSRSLLDRLFEQAGLAPQVVMELGSVEVIKRYVEIGLGVSIIPRFAAEDEFADGRLRQVRLDWLPRRAVGTIRRASGYVSPASRAFLELLEDLATGRGAENAPHRLEPVEPEQEEK